MIRKAMVTLAALLALAGGTRHYAWADQAADKSAQQLVNDRTDLKSKATTRLNDLDKKMQELQNRAVDTKKATQADIDQFRRDAEARRNTIQTDLAGIDSATKDTMHEVKATLDKDLDAYKKILDDWSSKTVKPRSTAAKPKPKPKK